jgi:hypothetical protein
MPFDSCITINNICLIRICHKRPIMNKQIMAIVLNKHLLLILENIHVLELEFIPIPCCQCDKA